MKFILSILIATPAFLAYPVALLCKRLHISTDWFYRFAERLERTINRLCHIDEV